MTVTIRLDQFQQNQDSKLLRHIFLKAKVD